MDLTNVEDVQHRLHQTLQGRVRDFAKLRLAPEKPEPYAGADPWLLSSLLQKAIRRGDLTTARRAGHQLLAMDSGRLWRRLMVVALEDIGLGDAERAMELVGLSCLPELRRLLGSNGRALDIALQRGCEATKERSGDHFCSLAREMARESHSLQGASQQAKLAVLMSSYLPWRRRLRAALLLAEQEGRAAERLAAFGPISEGFRALGVSEGFMDAAELYRFKAKDPLALFVPLAFALHLAQGGECVTISHSLRSPQLIGGVPDYAFDPLHTRLGRRAVELWLRSYLTRPPFGVTQVAKALWNLEAAACARTMDWSLGQEIAEQAHEADLYGAGVANHRHAELNNWVKEEFAILTLARKAAWESAMRQSLPAQGELALTIAAE